MIAIIVCGVVVLFTIPLLIGVIMFIKKRREKKLQILIPPDYDSLKFSEIVTKNLILVNPSRPTTWERLEKVDHKPVFLM